MKIFWNKDRRKKSKAMRLMAGAHNHIMNYNKLKITFTLHKDSADLKLIFYVGKQLLNIAAI